MSFCRECDQPLVWKLINGKNVSHNADGVEHRLTCTGAQWTRWRLRRGLVPGVFPMSVSRIETYRRCPDRFNRRYIRHLPDLESTEADFGKQFHAYAAARLIASRNGGPLPPRPPSPTVENVHEWMAMCAAFEAQIWDPSNIYGIEQPIEYQWQDDAMTIIFEGVMDLITIDPAGPSATIHDWKTGFGVEGPISLFTSIQAQSYALLLMRRIPDLKRIRFQQIQFRHGGRAVAAVHPTARRDYYLPEDLEEVERSLRQEVGRILRDTDFRANPACMSCPVGIHDLPALEYYKPITIEVANGFLEIPALKPPTSDEEAHRLALTAHVSRRVEEAARNAVRAWCAEHGPIAISPDEALGHWGRSNSKCRDVLGAMELLIENGYELARYVRLDMTAIKSLIEPTSRRYLPAMHHLIEERAASTYGFRKYPSGKSAAISDDANEREIPSAGRPKLTVIDGRPEVSGGD